MPIVHQKDFHPSAMVATLALMDFLRGLVMIDQKSSVSLSLLTRFSPPVGSGRFGDSALFFKEDK